MATPVSGDFVWSFGALNHAVVDSSGGYSFGTVDGSTDSYNTFTAPATGVWALDATISWEPALTSDRSACISTLAEFKWKASASNSGSFNYEVAFIDGPYSGPADYGAGSLIFCARIRVVLTMTQNDVAYLTGTWFAADSPSGYIPPSIGVGYTPGGSSAIPTASISA